MRIKLTRAFLNDQEALRFDTDVLGFREKTDVPAGAFRWLTVVSVDAPPQG